MVDVGHGGMDLTEVADVMEVADMTEVEDMMEIEVIEAIEVLGAEVTEVPAEDISEDRICFNTK